MTTTPSAGTMSLSEVRLAVEAMYEERDRFNDSAKGWGRKAFVVDDVDAARRNSPGLLIEIPHPVAAGL